MRTQCCDRRRIEHLLDGMLDFGFDAEMVRLYKKLCRYYFEIEPVATASYVYAYRDMWDEEGQGGLEAGKLEGQKARRDQRSVNAGSRRPEVGGQQTPEA